MRYFLKLIQNRIQIKLTRIQPKSQLPTTDALIHLIANKLALDAHMLIIKVLKDHCKLRVVSGWNLAHYGLKPGTQIQVELLSEDERGCLTAQQQEERGGDSSFLPAQSKAAESDPQDDFEEISSLAMQKYEQLLKLIQKNNVETYIQQASTSCPKLGPCENEFYRAQLRLIQNELGADGWAAIHYAVMAGSLDIVRYLIEIGVDVNIKTFDEWLPIHLAIKQQNLPMIDLLAGQPRLNVNLCTVHGLAINMAIEAHNVRIVERLLAKDANLAIRDHLGRTAYDALRLNPDFLIKKLLDKAEQRPEFLGQSYLIYNPSVSVYRGEVLCPKTLHFLDKLYYLCINPYSKVVSIYSKISSYPESPKHQIPMNEDCKFQLSEKSRKTKTGWFAKNTNLSYFTVSTSEVFFTFGCHYGETAARWVTAYSECFCRVGGYGLGRSYERLDTVIHDKPKTLQQSTKRKKSQRNLKKLGLISQKNTETIESLPTIIIHEINPQQTSASLKEESMDKQYKVPKDRKRKCSFPEALHPHCLKFSNFKLIKTLGKGTFGTVYLAQDTRVPSGKKYYALKCFNKKTLCTKNQIKYTVSELNILKQLSHPYIVTLHFAFQTPNYLYLGLDYCPGRSLSHYLIRDVTFPQSEAKIYTSEILLALEYLHCKNIIYRDLKPENIMLDEEWHLKLIDFGLSRQGQSDDFRAKSFCGSAAYLPPEMMSKNGVGKESDFYCMGAVLYEMVVGVPPFFSEDAATLLSNIKQSKLTFPKSISKDVRNLLSSLLERNPLQRLGYRGASEIKGHPFFRDVDWKAIEKRQVVVPVRDERGRREDTVGLETGHQDFDYTEENYRINRLANFSFDRQSIVNN